MNEVFDTVNTQFQQLPETTRQIILLYNHATNKIFNQCLTLTDSFVNQLIPTIYSNGAVKYYKRRQQHRDDTDLPAVIFYGGVVKYYENDQCYHHLDDDDHPIIIYQNGNIYYYKNGQIHRDGDLPAVIYPDGLVGYYKNGYRHRDGDLPAIICANGSVRYYKNGIEYNPLRLLPSVNGN